MQTEEYMAFLEIQFPTLKKDEREFLIVYDIPSVHDVSAVVLKAFSDAALLFMFFPPNSTHWPQ